MGKSKIALRADEFTLVSITDVMPRLIPEGTHFDEHLINICKTEESALKLCSDESRFYKILFQRYWNTALHGVVFEFSIYACREILRQLSIIQPREKENSFNFNNWQHSSSFPNLPRPVDCREARFSKDVRLWLLNQESNSMETISIEHAFELKQQEASFPSPSSSFFKKKMLICAAHKSNSQNSDIIWRTINCEQLQVRKCPDNFSSFPISLLVKFENGKSARLHPFSMLYLESREYKCLCDIVNLRYDAEQNTIHWDKNCTPKILTGVVQYYLAPQYTQVAEIYLVDFPKPHLSMCCTEYSVLLDVPENELVSFITDDGVFLGNPLTVDKLYAEKNFTMSLSSFFYFYGFFVLRSEDKRMRNLWQTMLEVLQCVLPRMCSHFLLDAHFLSNWNENAMITE